MIGVLSVVSDVVVLDGLLGTEDDERDVVSTVDVDIFEDQARLCGGLTCTRRRDRRFEGGDEGKTQGRLRWKRLRPAVSSSPGRLWAPVQELSFD